MKKKLKFIALFLLVLCLINVPMTSQAKTEENVTKSFKNTKKVSKLVNGLNEWCGYQYIYLLEAKENKTIYLKDKNILNIVGMGFYEGNQEGDSSASEASVLNRSKLIFGRKPSIDCLSTYDFEEASLIMNENREFICKLSKGGIYTLIGDWGTYYPSMKITKITKSATKTYTVKVKTYFTEGETNKKSITV